MKNREIKFRVFSEYTKSMQNVVSLWHRPDGTIAHVAVALDEDYMDVDTVFRNYQLMEFTGHKDKNGVDIYEADIVVCLNPESKNTGANDVITFKNSSFWLRHRNIAIDNWINYSDRDGDDWNGQFEVIGNIHENPELLNS